MVAIAFLHFDMAQQVAAGVRELEQVTLARGALDRGHVDSIPDAIDALHMMRLALKRHDANECQRFERVARIRRAHASAADCQRGHPQCP